MSQKPSLPQSPNSVQLFLTGNIIERSFSELNLQTPFLRKWHIEVLAAKLEAVRLGKIRRLIISIPPRSLKSQVLTR